MRSRGSASAWLGLPGTGKFAIRELIQSKYGNTEGFGTVAQFNFTYSPGTPIEQVIGTEIAGQIWSTFLQDDIEINLHMESAQLESNVLGGALPRIEAGRSFGQVRSHLAQDGVPSMTFRQSLTCRGMVAPTKQLSTMMPFGVEMLP